MLVGQVERPHASVISLTNRWCSPLWRMLFPELVAAQALLMKWHSAQARGCSLRAVPRQRTTDMTMQPNLEIITSPGSHSGLWVRPVYPSPRPGQRVEPAAADRIPDRGAPRRVADAASGRALPIQAAVEFRRARCRRPGAQRPTRGCCGGGGSGEHSHQR